MGSKKKLLSLSYMFLLLVVLGISFGSSRVNAITSAEIDVVVNTFLDNVENPSTAVNLNTFLSTKSSWGQFIFSLTQNDIHSWSNVTVTDFLNYVNSYDSLIIGNNAQSLQFQFFDSSWTRTINNTGTNVYGNNNYYSAKIIIYNTGDLPRLYYQSGLNVDGRSQDNIYNFISTVPIYNGQVLNETVVYYVEDYTPAPQNSVILTATSNFKYNFTQFNQCVAEIIGYSIDDFMFSIQRYDEDNQRWDYFNTFPNDWSWIVSTVTGDNNIYVYNTSLNAFPVGTYRYAWDYNGENAFTVVSNSFDITSGNSEGVISGNIDSNGDISGTVNNGNTVDNVKDFLSGPADFNSTNVTSKDLEKAVDYEVPENPYNNFIVHYFNSLKNALLIDTSDNLIIKVHTWGQTFNISVSDFIPNYNVLLSTIMTMFSTLVWCFLIIKWVTGIIESISLFEITKLVNNLNERYSNLF